MADLDPTVLDALNRILAKDHNDLTDYDKEFLQARSAYLSRQQKAEYADVLKEPASEKKARDKREAAADKAKEEAEAQSQEDLNAHLAPQDDEEEELG